MRFWSSSWDQSLSYLACFSMSAQPSPTSPLTRAECDPWCWLKWYHPGSQAYLVIGSRPYTVSMSYPTGEMVRPLNMSQMAFTQEQVTVHVYIVYSIITCCYSGQAEWNEWGNWQDQLTQHSVMLRVSGRGFITKLIFLRYVLSCLHLLTIMPNSGAQVPA